MALFLTEVIVSAFPEYCPEDTDWSFLFACLFFNKSCKTKKILLFWSSNFYDFASCIQLSKDNCDPLTNIYL